MTWRATADAGLRLRAETKSLAVVAGRTQRRSVPEFRDQKDSGRKGVNDAGVSILMIEQNVKEAMVISETAIALVSGQVLAQMPAPDFLNHPDIHALYTGTRIPRHRRLRDVANLAERRGFRAAGRLTRHRFVADIWRTELSQFCHRVDDHDGGLYRAVL